MMHDLAESISAELAERTPLERLVLTAGAAILARLALDVASELNWRQGFQAGIESADLRALGRDLETITPEAEG
jgi:hypothetical protein